MSDPNWMRIGELSRLSGVPRHTIHYYIKKGLLPETRRTGKTSAYYDASHLARLKEIEAIREERRTPLDFIKAELDSSQNAEGRPSRVKGQALQSTRDAEAKQVKIKRDITDAAIELFSREGYYRTGVKDITDHLGISTGTFYRYFESKQELFSHAVATSLKDILTEINYAIDKEKDLKKRMALRLAAMDRHYLRFSRIIYQLRAEAGVSGSWAEAGIVDIYHELALPIINDLRLAAEKGLIREVDFELAACSWIGAADIVLFRKNLDRKYSSEEVINSMVDLFFEGHSSDGI